VARVVRISWTKARCREGDEHNSTNGRDEKANRCVPASRFFRTNEMPSAWRIRYFEMTNSG
jgi:hypothetical protein